MKSWLVIALVLLAALPLQVAAKDTPSSPSPDLQFIDMMVPHHEHGIKMARMAEEKAQLPKLKSFAARSAIDQEKDIPELKSLRERFYANQPKADRIRMHEKTMMLDEMDRMSQKDT